MLDRREVPSQMIDCDEDKENLPSESDYEDLPSMYKDEDDDEEEDEDEDDDIFTSTWPPSGMLPSWSFYRRGRIGVRPESSGCKVTVHGQDKMTKRPSPV